MPQSRKSQVSLADTSYYHCISRCVRRAYLCGEDKLTGQNYEHRRQWVEDKILFLTQVFAIDVCAYSIMNNHTHIVLYVDAKAIETWSTRDILNRWHRLFKGTLLTQDFVNNKPLDDSQLLTVEQTASVYKKRLIDISWFMRILNECIARKANKEDKCTGRFWEGRFKSQALLDEAALMACMAYVELNPIRAKIATTPETSDYTSIKLRIQKAPRNEQPATLMPFVGNQRKCMTKGLPFELKDYIDLVDLTGRSLKDGKRGFINNQLPDILKRLNISAGNWLTISKQFTKVFHGAVGTAQVLTEFNDRQHKKRRCNISNIQKLFA